MGILASASSGRKQARWIERARERGESLSKSKKAETSARGAACRQQREPGGKCADHVIHQKTHALLCLQSGGSLFHQAKLFISSEYQIIFITFIIARIQTRILFRLFYPVLQWCDCVRASGFCSSSSWGSTALELHLRFCPTVLCD